MSNILPFNYIDDVFWSPCHDNKTREYFYQVDHLQETPFTKKECELLGMGLENVYVFRWILKHGVYEYFRDNNINIKVMAVKEVDLDKIDFSYPQIPYNGNTNTESMTHAEKMIFYREMRENLRQNGMEKLRKTYEIFPLHCSITDDEFAMMRLAL